MANMVVISVGSALLFLWGLSHLLATKSVVNGFGKISIDNRRIITMEWIMEGVSFIFIALLVIVTDSNNVNYASAGGLMVMAIVSAFTGARVKFLPYQLCPFVLTTVALSFVLGTVL